MPLQGLENDVYQADDAIKNEVLMAALQKVQALHSTADENADLREIAARVTLEQSRDESASEAHRAAAKHLYKVLVASEPKALSALENTYNQYVAAAAESNNNNNQNGVLAMADTQQQDWWFWWNSVPPTYSLSQTQTPSDTVDAALSVLDRTIQLNGEESPIGSIAASIKSIASNGTPEEVDVLVAYLEKVFELIRPGVSVATAATLASQKVFPAIARYDVERARVAVSIQEALSNTDPDVSTSWEQLIASMYVAGRVSEHPEAALIVKQLLGEAGTKTNVETVTSIFLRIVAQYTGQDLLPMAIAISQKAGTYLTVIEVNREAARDFAVYLQQASPDELLRIQSGFVRFAQVFKPSFQLQEPEPSHDFFLASENAVDSEAERRIALDSEAQRRIALDNEAQRRIALDSEAQRRIALASEAQRRIALDNEAQRRIALDNEAQRRIALDSEAQRRIALDNENAVPPSFDAGNVFVAQEAPVVETKLLAATNNTEAQANPGMLLGSALLLVVAVVVGVVTSRRRGTAASREQERDNDAYSALL